MTFIKSSDVAGLFYRTISLSPKEYPMQKQEDSRLEVVFGDSDKVDVWHNNVKVLEQISEAEFREYLDKLLGEGWKVSSTFNEGAGSELYFLRRTRT